VLHSETCPVSAGMIAFLYLMDAMHHVTCIDCDMAIWVPLRQLLANAASADSSLSDQFTPQLLVLLLQRLRRRERLCQ
jgi:hypothetical protein